MAKTRQHITCEERLRYRPAEGAIVTQNEIQKFLAEYKELNRAKYLHILLVEQEQLEIGWEES